MNGIINIFTRVYICMWMKGCVKTAAERVKTQRLRTWYSSELSPAAVATCSSCAGVCFLKIFCSKTKMFADSGEVCSSTARPPYLRQQMFFCSAGLQFFSKLKLLFFKTGEKCIFTVVIPFSMTIDFLISIVLD